MNQRRALNYPKASVVTRGDSALSQILARAFERSNEEDFDALTHGFHSWPARLHRSIAAEILDGVASEIGGRTVVDPFMGGGTTLVEAMIRGLPTLGIDLNPLAIGVAKVRTRVTNQEERMFLANAVDAVVEENLERIRAKAPSTAPLSKRETQWYDGHVLRGLAGLFEEIQKVEHPLTKVALEMVFSSIVVKFSRQRADTSDRSVNKRIGRFTATEFFREKGLELVARWEEFARAVPRDTPEPWLFESDARNVASIVRGKEGQRPAPGLILTSPPYGGTYDYAHHHARRLAWFDLDDRRMLKEEIGARRNVADHPQGNKRWDQEVTDLLRGLSQTMDRDSICVLVIGDAVAGGRFVPADEQLEILSKATGLVATAVASSKRPDWSERAPREEHLVALRKVDAKREWTPLPARDRRPQPKPTARPPNSAKSAGRNRARDWKEGKRPPRRNFDDDGGSFKSEDRDRPRPERAPKKTAGAAKKRTSKADAPAAKRSDGEGAQKSSAPKLGAKTPGAKKSAPKKGTAKKSAKAKAKEKGIAKAKTKAKVKAKAKKKSRAKKRTKE